MRLDALAQKVFSVLGEAGIPAEIIGGYALAHYGYVRNTLDVDLVVSDHPQALEVLHAAGFTEGRRWFSVVHQDFPGESVDVLPANRKLSDNVVPNPRPTEVSSAPVYTSLFNLLTLKLGVVVCNHADRLVQGKNRVDVGYLIRNNSLPRDYVDACPNEVVVFEFHDLWDELAKAKQAAAPDPFADFFDVR